MDALTRRAFVNVTPQVEECLRRSDVTEGIALINSMHTMAAVFVDDDGQGVPPRGDVGP